MLLERMTKMYQNRKKVRMSEDPKAMDKHREGLFIMYISNFHQHAIRRFCSDYNGRLPKAMGFGR